MRYQEGRDLKVLHTLAAPAVARHFYELECREDLYELPNDAHILGEGSNTLFVGELQRPIARLLFCGRSFIEDKDDAVILEAKAGESWRDLVAFSVDKGLKGLESLADIPGSVGAAPVQNIGAYGASCADCLLEVGVFDREKKRFLYLKAKDCGFSYRQSFFKSCWAGRFVIVSLRFLLRRVFDEEREALLARFAEVVALRRMKLPDVREAPNAGSFFHNPVVTQALYLDLKARYPSMPAFFDVEDGVKLSAAWLIEKAGFKGVFEGKVGMSARHALVLVNYGAKGEEVLAFADKVRQAVRACFKVDLVMEPVVVA